jgi:hypothetical protein
MSEAWLFVLIGVTPWVGAWIYYTVASLRKNPANISLKVNPADEAEHHRKWLEQSLREQIEAEAMAENACVRAEAAAAAVVSGDPTIVRKAAETAAKEAEAAAAAAEAANIMAKRVPGGRSEKAEDFAARAAQAGATAQAAVDALAATESAEASSSLIGG